MAFSTKAKLEGSQDSYQLNSSVKKYTLRDAGFNETNKGNFQFIRTMDTITTNKQGVKLKIVISSDLNSLKISTTTSNGLRTVNVYNGEAFKETRKHIDFTLHDFIERGILEKG